MEPGHSLGVHCNTHLSGCEVWKSKVFQIKLFKATFLVSLGRNVDINIILGKGEKKTVYL